MNLKPKIDIHIHIVGTGCCKSGCTVSQDFRKRLTFRAIKTLLRIKDHELDTNIDEKWAQMISQRLEQSSLDYGVCLGFDAVMDNGNIDSERTQLFVPNNWVFDLCSRYPNLLPGPSINPLRKNAIDLLDEVFEKKAVLIKWLPSTQIIDPSDKKIEGFYKKAAKLGIPLLIHIGGERTFKSYHPEYNHLERLKLPLEMGVKIICAHSATPIYKSGEPNQIPLLRTYLSKYPNLWIDNSGMCNPGRFEYTHELANDPLVSSRTIYGSDWPVPSNSIYFIKKLGFKKVLQLERTKNYFERDLLTKDHLGYPRASLSRANEVLSNLDHWIRI